MTGLHPRALRRLEKAKKFPRRVTTWVKLTTRPGKLRWKRDKILQWIEKDEETMRVKLLKKVMKPGMLMEKDYGSIRFHSPPGFWFSHGSHAMEFFPCKEVGSTRIWSALWKNRDVFTLKPCFRPCPHCQRQDVTVFSVALPIQYKFNKQDQKRFI